MLEIIREAFHCSISHVCSINKQPMADIKKLNLGSGQFKKNGYINVDNNASTKPDIIHDLESFPYPFKDNEFDIIEADHALEHLSQPWRVMRELRRIAKPNAKITITVPHFSRGFSHADHKCGFDVSFPLYFDPAFKGGYMGFPLKLKHMHLTWFAQPYLKKNILGEPIFTLASICGAIIDTLANVSPYFCSRVWCFWVGGFEQIEFEFICSK